MLSRLFTQSSVHPLSYLTAAFAAGIWWQYSFGSIQTFIVAICILATLAKLKEKRLKSCGMLIAFLITSFSFGASLLFYQEKQHQNLQQEICAEPYSIQGTILAQEPSSHPAMNSQITLRINLIKKEGSDWIQKSGSIHVYMKEKKELFVGDTIELHDVKLKKTSEASFKAYLIRNGIVATTFMATPDYTLLHRPWFSIRRFLWQARKNLYKRLNKKLSYQTSSLFFSTFLGNRKNKKCFFQKTKDHFKSWGILHFLARSGLHLVILIIIWELLLRLIPISFTIKQIIIILIGTLYSILSWPSLPFIRALTIFLIYKTSSLTNARSSPVYCISLICLAMLITNPIQFLFLDFQLSFGLTFVLAWFSQQQQKRLFTQNY